MRREGEPHAERSGAATSGSAAPRYAPLRGLTTALTSLLVVGVLVDALAVVSDFAEYGLLSDVVAGRPVSLAEATSSDRRQATIGLVQLAVFLATAILFIIWTHRAYSNIEALGATNLRFGRGWAIGGWLVPIMWYWRPKQIWNDVWRASDPDLPAREPGWRGRPVPGVALAWWWAFVLASLLGSAVFRLRLRAETPAEVQTASAVTLVADVASVVAGILAVVVVRMTARRQDERARRLSAQAAGTGHTDAEPD